MSDHLTAEQLYVLLNDWEKKIPRASVWYHWKTPEVTYRIVDMVVIEVTDTIGVVYEQSGTGIRFLRPASEFVEQIDKELYSGPRFILMTNE